MLVALEFHASDAVALSPPQGGYVGGALSVLANAADVEVCPVFLAGGPSAGVLEHASFLAMANELLDGVRAAATAGPIDGVYVSMHGAMVSARV